MTWTISGLPCASLWKRVLVLKLSSENEFDLPENEPVGGTHFQMNSFAFILVLIQKATRKYPIAVSGDLLSRRSLFSLFPGWTRTPKPVYALTFMLVWVFPKLGLVWTRRLCCSIYQEQLSQKLIWAFSPYTSYGTVDLTLLYPIHTN